MGELGALNGRIWGLMWEHLGACNGRIGSLQWAHWEPAMSALGA